MLTIFLEPAANTSAGHQMRRMEAQGPVTVTAKDQIGTGDAAVYDKAENKVFLTGHVTLSQGANVTKGERLVYDLNTTKRWCSAARARAGRVRSDFTPGEKSAAAPPPAGESRTAATAKTRKQPAPTPPCRPSSASEFRFCVKSVRAPQGESPSAP